MSETVAQKRSQKTLIPKNRAARPIEVDQDLLIEFGLKERALVDAVQNLALAYNALVYDANARRRNIA